MLEANKSLWFERFFALYNRNLLARRFNSLHVSGLNLLKNKQSDKPLLIFANHSSWWDGLIAFQLSNLSRLDSYIMMEEKHLKNLRLFRKLGAFSVIRENSREALKSVEYAANLLNQNAGRTLWIFPQGEIKPNDIRPLRFYNGLARIILSLRVCSVISLSLRYEFLGEYKPDIFVKIKETGMIEDKAILKPKTLSNVLEEHLTENLNELRFEITNGNISGYERIY